MKNYPAKSNKRKNQVVTDRFDQSKLTAFDWELLQDFEERRRKFNRLMEESNIVHNKKTCPGCGFPSMDTDEFYDTCIICLWEGEASDAQETFQGPPNYVSLMEHRITISRFLREFLKSDDMEVSVDVFIKRIKAFEKGQIPINREDFERNLKNILSPNSKRTNTPF